MSPTTSLIVSVIQTVGSLSYNVYIFSGMVLVFTKGEHGARKMPLANLLWYWTKWPALAYLLTNPFLTVLAEHKLKWYNIVIDAFNIFIWWFYRNHGDDDDHKKLKKRAKEMVKSINGKLVVVPVRA